MRKILNIILITTFGLLIAGCSDDNDNSESSLKVIKSTDTSFDATGGQATIEVSSSTAIEVSANQEWCTTSINGTTITLTVSENYDLEGRNALITISSGGETTQVSISQLGTIFNTDVSELSFNVSESGEAKITILANSFPLELIPSDSWIKAKLENNTIIINVDATVAPRQGVLTIKCGNRTIDISINQTVLKYNDLIGDWILTCTKMSGNTPVTASVKISKNEEGKSYILSNVGSLGIPCVLNFDAQTSEISLAPQYINKYGTYEIYLTIINPYAGRITWDSTITYAAKVEASSSGKLVYKFYDNGSWANNRVAAIGVTAFSAKIENEGEYLGNFDSLVNLVLTKQ